MIKPIGIVFLAVLLIRGTAQGMPAAESQEPQTFFRNYVGLSDDQIRDISAGKAFAKLLQSPTPDEVFVFGAVYINATPESYLKLAGNIDALRKLPSYLELQRFSNPAQLSDLNGFVLDKKDVDDLQHCAPGHCEVQLPTEAMDEFQRSVNWNAPDHAAQVNRLAQRMALEGLLQYQRGGNSALGTYRDKSHPTAVAETFASLLGQMKGLPVYLPDLNRYLLDYPTAGSSDIKSEFYWEKVSFGLKPTLRIVQAVIYRGVSPLKPDYAVAVKQLYSSHYFETALDLTVCVTDSSDKRKGFYLITIKGSQQAGLTGFKGSIVRNVAVDKTRGSLQKALSSYKQELERPGN